MFCRSHSIAIILLGFLPPIYVNTAAAQSDRTASTSVACSVGAPPEILHLDPFYKKYCFASGITVASSEHVADAALQMTAEILSQMLGPMPEVRERLVAVNLRIALIGEHEVTTDIPEYKVLKQMYPNRDYDTRTLGIGAMTAQFPITSGAEENLLCYRSDRYRGENIGPKGSRAILTPTRSSIRPTAFTMRSVPGRS